MMRDILERLAIIAAVTLCGAMMAYALAVLVFLGAASGVL